MTGHLEEGKNSFNGAGGSIYLHLGLPSQMIFDRNTDGDKQTSSLHSQ